ncbi:unnamed protein product (macronuclear) [Paramecium tetraurelia]|uniref:Uncharacterized protein n=1 Tax=Paramecium tetraurelia TaxID=5888 RepID=A0E6E3_PARTE|nr:uncharacterized protein GSPATT00003725001 [Paramecium tetraurelia]CAK90860.1 unnamed protein product [Paramecium tetraurelia]|eukprot:XP_001458257.1 hypothetical protein (macronuclear) [Paramecium tetraurelia strain d4-2]
MQNFNPAPVFSACFEGRYYWAFPVYRLKLQRETQHQVINEMKLEQTEQMQEKKNFIEQNQDPNPTTIHKSYMYPGQSKNFYKTLGQKVCSFIQNNFDVKKIKKDLHISKFINVKRQNYNKSHFRELIKSKIGKQVIKIYFGNFIWCSSILEKSRSDIAFYLSLNKKIFERKHKAK